MKFEEYENNYYFFKKFDIHIDTVEEDKKEWGIDDEMDIEEIKDKINEFVKMNHPIHFRFDHLRNGKWKDKNEYMNKKKIYYEKMKKAENLYKVMICNNYINRRRRRMKKENKEIHFGFNSIEMEELDTKMDEAKSYFDTIDRKIMRNYCTETQMDYFNESFEDRSDTVGGNDPLSEFFKNPIRNVKNKVEDFESNDRITRNEEWVNYENQREQIENEVNYENIPMENFHDIFEKNRSKIDRDYDILNGNPESTIYDINPCYIDKEMQSTSSRARPMTLEELMKERDDQI
jgi:hypothetical protein